MLTWLQIVGGICGFFAIAGFVCWIFILAKWFRPKHTAREVASVLVSGLRDGSIALKREPGTPRCWPLAPEETWGPREIQLTFWVSRGLDAEILELLATLNLSRAELFRYALSVIKIATDEAKLGRKLALVENGVAVREFILPEPKRANHT